MANLYFSETALDESTETVTLVGDEARHAAKVARVRVGEHIEVSDGRGWRANITVTAVDAAVVTGSVDSTVFEPEPAIRFTLAQALAKGDRDERAIQMATELGVARVVPWSAARSVSVWSGDKVAKGIARWTAIVREAAKQSMRSRIPVVGELVTATGLCSTDDDTTWIVLDPRAERTLSEWSATTTADHIGIIVGPEGGITDDEIAEFVSAGVTAVRLNSPILRTSTAGPATIAALSALRGQW